MKRTMRGVMALALLGFLMAIGCYTISKQTPQPAQTVTLSDEFLQNVTLTVDEPLQFCAPTSKNGLPILRPEEHLTMYGAAHELSPHLRVFTQDQFGPRTLEAVGARVLLVPTQKLVGELGFPTRKSRSISPATTSRARSAPRRPRSASWTSSRATRSRSRRGISSAHPPRNWDSNRSRNVSVPRNPSTQLRQPSGTRG